MKIKVGEIVKNEVFRSKIPKTQIVKELKKSRPWFDDKLKSDEMDPWLIFRIGKAIRYDFRKDFPELTLTEESLLTESSDDYDKMESIDLRNKLLEVQSKYVALLEEHIKLLNGIKEQQ